MKKTMTVILFINLLFSLFSDGQFIEYIDKMNYDGDYSGALKALEARYNEEKSVTIAWMIARECIFISEISDDRKEIVGLYGKGIEYTKPFLDMPYNDAKEQAALIYWYTINYASKVRDQGIFAGREGMNIIPEVFRLINKCLEIHPEFAEAYFFRGRFYGEIPGFLGGSKIKMETDYALCLKYAGEDERIFLDLEISKSLFKRNWQIENKLKEAKKSSVKDADLLSAAFSDRELGILLLNGIEKKLSVKNELSFREKGILEETTGLLKEKNKN